MNVIHFDKLTATIRMTTAELILLANTINEAKEAVDEIEFGTRLGASVSEANELQRHLRNVVDLMTG